VTATCDELRPLLDLAPLGLLEASERVTHDAHLAGCAPCRRDADALAAIHAADRAAVEEEVLPMPARLEDTPVEEKKKTAAPGPAVDPARVEAVGRLISLACSFCHGRTTREEIVFCASCVAPHHAECFATHGRCALPGCEEKATVRPHLAAPSPRRSGRVLALAFVACTGLGAAAWSALRPDPLAPSALLAQAHTHQRDLLLAVRDDDRARADDALAGLEAACANAEAGDPTLAGRTGALRQEARRARRTLEEVRISLEARDEDLDQVVARIAEAAGRNILVEPNVTEKVTVSLQDLRWTELLRTVANMTSCRIRELPGGVLVLAQPPKVTLQFTDANIRTVLQLLAAYSGKNVVIEEDVVGSVTLDLKEVPWDEALLTLARANHLHVTLWGEIVLVSSRPREGQPLVPREQEWTGDALPEVDDEALIDVVVRDATISAVCASIARQSGRRVEALGCGDWRVSLDLRQVPWRGAVDALAAMARLDVLVRDTGEVLFTPIASNLLMVEGAQATTWAGLLATVAGVNVVVPAEAAGAVVSMRLPNTDPLKALDALAHQLGWTFQRRQGDVYELLVPQGWRPARTHAKPAPLTLQATIMTPDGAWAIISDRTYAQGDALFSEAGAPLPGSAVLDVVEGTARVRVAVGDTRTLRLQQRTE
jgi:hypothetical protein